MSRISRRQGLVILIFLLIVGSIGIVDSRFLGIGLIPDSGGMCFVSQTYNANANESYSIDFVGVTFTFLYWTYPPPTEGPNGTSIYVTDLPHTAYFLISFEDGVEETLSLNVGGYVGILPFQIPFGPKTNHTSPSAGVVTADTQELWGKWKFTVTIFS